MLEDEDLMWTATASGTAIVAGLAAKKLLGKGWERKRGKAPANPASPTTGWGEAIAWALVSGIVVGLVRLVAQRGVAAAFQARRGHLPAQAHTEATA